MGVNKKPRSKRLSLKRKKKKYEPEVVLAPSLGKIIDSVVPRFRGFYEASGLKFSEYEWKQSRLAAPPFAPDSPAQSPEGEPAQARVDAM